MSRREWLLRLGEKGAGVNARTLLGAISKSLAILNEIRRDVAAEGEPSLTWCITRASMSSPLEMVFEAEAPLDLADRVVKPFLKGIRMIQVGSEKPPHFSPKALRKARDLALVLGDGVSRIEFESPGEGCASLTLQLAANVERLLGTRVSYYSATAVRGRLEKADIHETHRDFVVYDEVTGQGVECNIRPERKGEVPPHFGRRVAVSGVAKYNEVDILLFMNVDTISVLPEAENLPQLEDLHKMGVNLTRGKSPEDIVRGLRDDEI